jgi:NADH-quinone oxidoreductase subunit L
MWIGTLAIAGVWPFAGFFSKDEIIWQTAARAVGPFSSWFSVFWVMAEIAAVLTAFYMTRLMIMTFHGTNRTGEEEAHHMHESPLVMTVPLIILAVLSVVGGWLNVPEAVKHIPVLGWVPGHEWLHEWLHPVTNTADEIIASNVGTFVETAPFGGGEAFWAVVTFAFATAIIVVTTMVLGKRTVRVAVQDVEPSGFRRVLYRKWYVDEIYDALIVRPVLFLSRLFWRFIDQGIIDGLFVNGVGHLSRGLGWVGSRLQTGQVNTYAFAVIVGVLLLLGFVVF